MNSPLDKLSWNIGTMGFSFPDWVGVFYPNGLSSDRYLSYYSRIFNSVEIDSTFYGTPDRRTIERWRTITPSGFKICLKVPRSITHESGLVNVEFEMLKFIEVAGELEDKLGVVLIQLPPDFSIKRIKYLADFINILPEGIRFAVEVRNPTWFRMGNDNNPLQFYEILRERNVCLASTEFPGVPNSIVITSDILYIRWIGRHGTFNKFVREEIDRRAELIDWLQRIHSHSNKIHTVYGYFNNDYSGFSPVTANQFKNLDGQKTIDFRQPLQGKMF